MTFHDHIENYDPNGFDFATANRLLALLVARMFLILDMALITKDHGPLTEWASQYRRVVCRLIREAIQAERFPCYEPTDHLAPPEYEYDGTHKANFRGMNAPISVWPEEFIMFTEREAEGLGAVGPKVSEWLKAIARRAETEREAVRRKSVTGQLVYAPP